MLAVAPLTLQERTMIVVSLPANIALQKEFENLQIELMPYLVNQLQNETIKIKVKKLKTSKPKSAKHLTEQEKLELLSKEYPLLTEAMNRLGLSLEK